MSDKVVTEEIGGQVQRSYAYSAWGARLSQVKHDTDGTGPEVIEDSFYGYNPHTDVETLTSETGDTRATYGYTAYGKDDEEAFTGIDKPDAQNPGEEPYNFYRFNGKRWDPSSGSYDMGFRDYNPGLNRFTTRDNYNGALADLNMAADPWTGNRYAFTSGNPISGIEIDGHCFIDTRGNCTSTEDVESGNIDQPATPPSRSGGVESQTYTNGTVWTETPDGQSYINGFSLPSGGPRASALAPAIDAYLPQARHLHALGSGALSQTDTAGVISGFCQAEGHQDICGR
ncbi:RHS repeat-associated core domain-containing protein [Amycolatopsis palatopharyngis]|uniref:RHS repeat-associated core domain-containing protein n=1 Tax=Amycolatopsis palatopharyngis TaxID=187982 RepID=UPI001FEBE0FC|nr:RHS repeat-associated core domain-containing protein [Amycolatopsis palatopharyngis]